MKTKFEKENLIKKFLFGEMSDDERLAFEDDFLLDESLFEEVKVIEDELIEKYVREWMDSAERSKFEEHFLTTNKRREKVQFTKRLLGKVDKERFAESPAIVSTAETTTFWEKLAAFFRTPQFAIGGAFALFLMIAGGIFLFQFTNRGSNEIVQGGTPTPTVSATQTPFQELTPTPETPNTNINVDEITEGNTNLNKFPTPQRQNTNKKPIRKQTPKKVLRKTPKTEKTKPKKTPAPRVNAPSPILALFSGTVRSGGKTSQINLPQNAKSLRLRLNLENVDYKSYVAQITDADGNVLYKSGKLKPRKSRLFLSVPAKKFKRGDYLVNLSGINQQGESESVADFQFRVNRK